MPFITDSSLSINIDDIRILGRSYKTSWYHKEKNDPIQPLAQRLAKATLVEGDNSQVARIRHWDELIITVGLMPNVNNTLCQEIVKYFNLVFASKVSLLSEHVAALHSVQLITRKPKDVAEKMRAARKYYFESGNYCRDIGRRVPGDLNSVKIRFFWPVVSPD